MFGLIQLRWRLRQLQRACRGDEQATDRAVLAAKARGASQQEIDEITGGSDAPVMRYKVRMALSDYLIAEADRLFVPLPDEGDETMWTVGDDGTTTTRVLTRAGINAVRTAIRAEKKASSERFLMMTAGLVGLIGAATALASQARKENRFSQLTTQLA